MGLFLSAEVGVLLGEHRQPLFQPGIEGVDACRVLSLVEQNDGFFSYFVSFAIESSLISENEKRQGLHKEMPVAFAAV